MRKQYEKLVLCFIWLEGEDVLTSSQGINVGFKGWGDFDTPIIEETMFND